MMAGAEREENYGYCSGHVMFVHRVGRDRVKVIVKLRRFATDPDTGAKVREFFTMEFFAHGRECRSLLSLDRGQAIGLHYRLDGRKVMRDDGQGSRHVMTLVVTGVDLKPSMIAFQTKKDRNPFYGKAQDSDRFGKVVDPIEEEGPEEEPLVDDDVPISTVFEEEPTKDTVPMMMDPSLPRGLLDD